MAPVFVLADLAALYTTRMEQLGTIMTGRVHSTKLKNHSTCFQPGFWSSTTKECGQDADDDAIHLARAANIVRRVMLKMKTA